MTSVAVLRPDELEWESFESGVRFGAEWADLSRRLGAAKLGYGAWVLRPGRVSVPYHYHLVNEELALVLEGEPSIRLDGAETRLGPGDVVAMPPGEASAHQLFNRSGSPARLVLFSTMEPHDWVGYPDSGKEMVRASGLARDPSRGTLLFKGDRILTGEADGPYFLGEPVDEPLGDPGPAPAEPDGRIVRVAALEWEPYTVGRFRAARKGIGAAGGARRLGCSAYRVEPGERPGPFHAHRVNEEAFVVLSGRGALRTLDGEVEIGPGDVAACPPGPGSAHALRAIGEAPLEILAISTMEEPEIVEYPDTGEVRVLAGSPPGGDVMARTLDLSFRREQAVERSER